MSQTLDYRTPPRAKPRPKDVLSDADYRNYRNVRTVAYGFVTLGALFAMSVLFMVLSPATPSRSHFPVLALVFGFFLGFGGLIAGIAVLCGSRSWSPLVYVVAGLYVYLIPIGTLMGCVVMLGLRRYFVSCAEVRIARTLPAPPPLPEWKS